MSEESSGCYSLGESSGYSYKDLAVYQFSDDEHDSVAASSFSHDVDRKNIGVPAAVMHAASSDAGSCNTEEEEGEPEPSEVGALWNSEDDGSYVMYTQSDDDDDLELYQFSDEDLIPEEPDEEWIVAALLSNRWDYDHLELLLEELEDFPRLVEAIYTNQVIKAVTVYESFIDKIATNENKTILAEAICNLQNLEQLKVYYHSSFFVGPLQRVRPPNLNRLCLMFFPGQPTKETLSTLTEFLKEDAIATTNNCNNTASENSEAIDDNNGNEHDSITDGNNDEEDNANQDGTNDTAADHPVNTPLQLESLSVRCELMDDDFIQAIDSGMESNETITTLSFWGNNVKVTEKGNLGSARIDFYLRLNQSGIRDFHLLVNATPEEFLDKIMEERENTNMIYYLLESNPSFLSYYRDLDRSVGDESAYTST